MLGLIGRKLGMTQIFDEQGAPRGVTVIEVEPNLVVAQRTPEKDGYSAVVLGWGKRKPSRRKKPVAGQFPEGMEPTRLLREVKGFERDCKTGDRIGVEAFSGVRWVDVIAVSKGKGFQGVVKRYHFGGGPKSHGSLVKREGGSTGQAHVKTLPGRKMAGRMGGERTTVQNLRLLKIDPEKGVLLVHGAVPGAPGSPLFVSRAKKKGSL
jgi:large subunit ribosomal protein L3